MVIVFCYFLLIWSQISLSWAKGNKADNTYIRYKQGGTAPVDRTDGIFFYNGTGTTKSATSLSANTQYSFKAWSWNNTGSIWSLYNSTDSATTQTASTSGPSDDDDDNTEWHTIEIGFDYEGDFSIGDEVLVEQPTSNLWIRIMAIGIIALTVVVFFYFRRSKKIMESTNKKVSAIATQHVSDKVTDILTRKNRRERKKGR